MSWITPKENWTSNDYYNLEDAQRIAGNICHLGDMANQIYGDKYIRYAYVYKTRRKPPYQSYTETIFGRWPGVFWNYTSSSNFTVVQPDQYNRTLVDWLDKDTTNLTALTKFILLSSFPDAVQITEDMKYTYADTDKVGGGVWITDSCIHNYTNAVQFYTYNSPLTSIWITWGGRLPLSGVWTTESNHYYSTITTDYSNLRNKAFWTSNELNWIETAIKLVYNRFTSYIGG